MRNPSIHLRRNLLAKTLLLAAVLLADSSALAPSQFMKVPASLGSGR